MFHYRNGEQSWFMTQKLKPRYLALWFFPRIDSSCCDRCALPFSHFWPHPDLFNIQNINSTINPRLLGHTSVLRHTGIIREAREAKKKLTVVWLDRADTYGLFPHKPTENHCMWRRLSETSVMKFQSDSMLESLRKHDNNWKGGLWEETQFHQFVVGIWE